MDLDLFYGMVDKALVDETHARGAKINVWTPGRVEDGERMAEIGVDFITSNSLWSSLLLNSDTPFYSEVLFAMQKIYEISQSNPFDYELQTQK